MSNPETSPEEIRHDETGDEAGSAGMNCSPSSLTPETDAMIAADLHHMEDDETCPVSAYWRIAELTRTMERERDEWHYNAMRRLAVDMLSCMWCGELVHAPKGFMPGSPMTKDQRAQAYREHVSTCPAHPIRDAENEIVRLKCTLAKWQEWARMHGHLEHAAGIAAHTREILSENETSAGTAGDGTKNHE